MTRSPLAYPLNRGADMDAGGAADLQTDIMRFMAILSLCLVAIFALVQSIPITPAEPMPVKPVPVAVEQAAVEPLPAVVPKTAAPEPVASPQFKPDEKAVALERPTLTRPGWVPEYPPADAATSVAEPAAEIPAAVPADPPATPAAIPPLAPPVDTEVEGFTLRFESDAALTRLVAASRVGVYAIESSRARRMAVRESRISFWDASTPNTFHEMETTTVPAAVIAALSHSGATIDRVSWGVTLPGKLTRRLDDLMQQHQGGTLIITASGDIRWEAT